MRFRLLGPVTADVELGPAKQRAVLVLLALRANQSVARDEIIDGVWGEDVPPSAPNLVATYVARLRRLIEPGRSPRAASQLLSSTVTGYSLRLPPGELDVEVFEKLAAQGEIDAALALWRGTPLDGVPGPFAAVQRQRLIDRRLTVLEHRIALGLRRDEDWTSELTRLVAEHPYRERLRALLMTALHQGGLWAEALAVYEDARRTLSTELGVEPGVELRRAYRRTLAAPDLAWHYLERVEDADRLLRPGRGRCVRFGSYGEAMAWLEGRRRAIVDAGVSSDNPAVAASLATSLRAFMHRRGYWADLRRLAAVAAGHDDDQAAAQGLLELGGVDYLRGRLVQADAQVTHSLTLFRLVGDTAGTARALNNLSMIRADLGRHSDAAALAQEHLALCGNPADRSVALDNLALIAVRQGRFADALRWCEESLGIHRSIGSSVLASAALHLRGMAYGGLGDRVRGRASLRSGIRLARLAGNVHRERLVSASLAQLSG